MLVERRRYSEAAMTRAAEGAKRRGTGVSWSSTGCCFRKCRDCTGRPSSGPGIFGAGGVGTVSEARRRREEPYSTSEEVGRVNLVFRPRRLCRALLSSCFGAFTSVSPSGQTPRSRSESRVGLTWVLHDEPNRRE